ncbi:uncharacterized protein LOC120703051 isoform X2 [Panicum virgatum]|uniref:uncharacterized protein LOC120703051 isoform X2 n=1 Tax=Panicum virgatum TaxID=38727 RepID=UPI0019D567CB|nr:uncharacterized protein LOC120703051 isoform X2 [Panicum virgatum]
MSSLLAATEASLPSNTTPTKITLGVPEPADTPQSTRNNAHDQMHLVIPLQRHKKALQKRSRPSPRKKVAKKLFTGEETADDGGGNDSGAATSSQNRSSPSPSRRASPELGRRAGRGDCRRVWREWRHAIHRCLVTIPLSSTPPTIPQRRRRDAVTRKVVVVTGERERCHSHQFIAADVLGHTCRRREVRPVVWVGREAITFLVKGLRPVEAQPAKRKGPSRGPKAALPFQPSIKLYS